MFDVEKIRLDFSILEEKINGKRNCFLDTAASSQKPKVVLDKIQEIYQHFYANVHRGSYQLAEISTLEFEKSRQIVQKFLNAKSEKEIVFVRNATEGINLVASSWGRHSLKKNDQILISEAEHHANLVPWQMLRDELGIKLNIFKLNEDGSFNFENFTKALNEQTKLVAVTAQSNVLGTVYPIKEMVQKSHDAGAKILVDACQYAVHHRADVIDWDCDFLVFSGHKTYGPSGIGVLYGKLELLDSIPPYQFGGDMVKEVSFEKTTFATSPAKFEAGTPAIVEAIGLGEALKYIQDIGFDNIEKHEKEISSYMLAKMLEIRDLKLIGPQTTHSSVFAFQLGSVHPQDLAFILDKEGVAVRTGHHCAQPIVNRFGYTSLARASIGVYTNHQDIDQFIAAINKAKTFF